MKMSRVQKKRKRKNFLASKKQKEFFASKETIDVRITILDTTDRRCRNH